MNQYRIVNHAITLLIITGLLVSLLPTPVWAATINASVQAIQARPDREPAAPSPPSLQPSAAETAPAALANPMTLSHIQTAKEYAETDNGMMVITYTVRNNLTPATVPNIPAGATITQTAAIMQDFDFAADTHTLRNVIISNQLADAVSLLASTPAADASGATHLFSLGDIAPLATATAVLTINVGTNADDFTSLIDTAEAYSFLRGHVVQSSVGAAQLAPPSFGQWLIDTPDADIDDIYLLTQSAALNPTTADLFAYVSALDYHAYKGSLRGSRGTLWNGAGNAADKASLLIALLRANGIPARYRHGQLTTAQAQTIIATIFDALPRARGHVPADAPIVGDPLNNADLIAEVRDHWWVEVYIDGSGWTDLDPTYPNAAIGDVFATAATDSSDRIAELPNAHRHTVTFKLKIEDYSAFNISSAIPGLDYSYPFVYTLPTVELIGRPVSMRHLVETSTSGGLVFGGGESTYTPFLIIGDSVLAGDAYQEIYSSFAGGLGNVQFTAAWLQIETEDTDGNTTVDEREIVDKIGFAARTSGGAVQTALGAGTDPLFRNDEVFTVLLAPSVVPLNAIDDLSTGLIDALDDARIAQQYLATVDRNNITADLIPDIRDNQVRVADGTAAVQKMLLMTFAAYSDESARFFSDSFFVKPYYDSPRVIMSSLQTQNGTAEIGIDLVNNGIRPLLYPDQSYDAVVAFNYARGLQDMSLESALVEDLSGRAANSVNNLFDAAAAQGIELALIDSGGLDTLAQLAISDLAKARIMTAVREQSELLIIVPAEAVTLNGESMTGWLELNMVTGETIDTMENGQHVAAVSYAFLSSSNNFQEWLFAFIGTFHGFFAYTMSFLGEFLARTPIRGNFGAVARAAKDAAKTRTEEIAKSLLNIGSVSIGPCKWTAPGATNSRVSAFVKGVSGTIKVGTVTVGKVKAGPFSCGKSESAAKLTVEIPMGFLNGASFAAGVVDSSVDPPVYSALLAPIIIPDTTASTASTTLASTPDLPATWAADLTVRGSRLITVADGSHYAPAVAGLAADADGVWLGINNYANVSTVAINNADLIFDVSTGTMNINEISGERVVNSVVVADYTGDVAISEVTAALDSAVLAGTADLFTLDLDTYTSTLGSVSPVAFDTAVRANFGGDFTLSAAAPDDWTAALDSDGTVTITPPPGAEAGAYAVLVSAESAAHPGLFSEAIHTIIIQPYNAVAVGLAPDPLITVPVGDPIIDTATSNPNSGQLQLPDAAYTILITNASSMAHDFNVTVSGLPDGWTLLSGGSDNSTDITLGAGAIGEVGFYIQPSAPLPAAGTQFAFDVVVTATDGSGLTTTETAVFTMPAAPFSYLAAAPAVIYVPAGGSAPITVDLTNVGNAAAAYPLNVTVPAGWSGNAAVSPVMLDAGQTNSQNVLINAPSTAVIGSAHTVLIDSPVTGTAYIHSVPVAVEVVDTALAGLYDGLAQLTGSDDAVFAACARGVLRALNTFVADLSDLTARDLLVAELQKLAGLLDATAGTAALQAVITDLRTTTDAADFPPILVDLGAALQLILDELAIKAQYPFALTVSPSYGVYLSGETTTYTVTIANHGDAATSYALTITTPSGTSTFAPTVPAGSHHSESVSLPNSALGFYALAAAAVVVDTGAHIPATLEEATAVLNVVDAFLEISNITADPPFVESATGQSDLTMQVRNIANVPFETTAVIEIVASDGTVQFSDRRPFTLSPFDATTYALGTVNTSGWAEGGYIINVRLVDETGAVIPDAIRAGALTVGQALRAEISVSDDIVPPGDPTIKTMIETYLTNIGQIEIGGGAGVIAPALVVDAVANGANSDHTVGVSLTLEAGTYDIVIEDGAYQTAPDLNWYSAIRASVSYTETVVKDYYLGYGTDYHAGGSPTQFEAIMHNQGQRVRVYLPEAATVSFWVQDGDATDNIGDVTLSVTQLYEASDSRNRQVEGALGHSLPHQSSETLAFDNWSNDNECLACHVQAQGLLSADAVYDKIDPLLVDTRFMQAIQQNMIGSVNEDGNVADNGGGALPNTTFALWALSESLNLTERPTPLEETRQTAGVYRYEETHPHLRFNGVPFNQAIAWQRYTNNEVSNGRYTRGQGSGNTISIDFDGGWIGIGLLGTTSGGQVDVLLDGVSLGIIDTYRRETMAFSRYYTVPDGAHTLTLQALDTANDFSSNTYIHFDYFDLWDGTTMAAGLFEERDDRVAVGDDWRTGFDHEAANDGTWLRDGSNAWFLFTGDSVGIKQLNYSSAGAMRLFVDGELLDTVSAYHATTISNTLSYNGLGAGPHVLHVQNYRGSANVDAFIAPGVAPFTVPAADAPEPYQRYEEDHAALLFNGAPFDQTNNWTVWQNGILSDGYGYYTDDISDTVSFTFEGAAVGVGLRQGSSGGIVEVEIDGVRQPDIDTYNPRGGSIYERYDVGLGTHTITLRNSANTNPNASRNRTHFDYIDVWNGDALPVGVFEEDDGRLYTSSDWREGLNEAAEGGRYEYDGTEKWFAFTGDSVSYRAFANTSGGEVRVEIDGDFVGNYSLYSPTEMTRTFSFDNLGSGAHLISVSEYRGRATVDQFITPAVPSDVLPVVASPLTRYEEDDPALLYNGVPLGSTSISWIDWSSSVLSEGYANYTDALSDTVSLTFEGEWAAVGFRTGSSGGIVEVELDGVRVADIDTYTPHGDTAYVVYPDLGAGEHTLLFRNSTERNPFASRNRIHFDFIDVWDGTSLPDGTFTEDDGRVRTTADWREWVNDDALDGRAEYNGSAKWFPFMGDSVSLQVVANTSTDDLRVYVDGVWQGVYALAAPETTTQTLTFDGFGSGLHVISVESHRGQGYVDGFVVPGVTPNENPPAPDNIYRVEEDDAAILYSGFPWFETSGWTFFDRAQASDRYAVYTDLISDTISYTFTGERIGVGFLTFSGAGMVDVLIDGVSQGLVDTYGVDNGNLAVYYDVAPGTHTITLVNQTMINPAATRTRLHFDYFEVWNGGALAQGTFQPEDGRVWRSNDWRTQARDEASDGQIYYDGSAMWFSFTDDSATVQLYGDTWTGVVEVLIDGVSRGTYTTTNDVPTVLPFDFTGLGVGAHTMLVRPFSGRAAVDAFVAPAGMPVTTTMSMRRSAAESKTTVARDSYSLPPVALQYTPIPTRTYTESLIAMADYLAGEQNADGTWTASLGGTVSPFFWNDAGGTDGKNPSMTAYNMVSMANMYELTADMAYLDVLTRAATALTTMPFTRTHPVAIHQMIGLDAARPYMTGDLANDVIQTMLDIDDYLRLYQQPDGGWGESAAITETDVLPTAGALYALTLLNPSSNDPVITRAVDYLLAEQRVDGFWESRFVGNNDEPLMVTTWVNLSLPYVFEVLSSFDVEIDHLIPDGTVAVTGGTVTPAATVSAQTGEHLYEWAYQILAAEGSRMAMYEAVLPDMQPGEIRQVTNGTIVDYVYEGGSGQVALPPVVVQAGHLIEIAPSEQTTLPGGRVQYDIALTNWADTADTYTLDVIGLPSAWVTLPETVALEGDGTAATMLIIDVPEDVDLADYPFAVTVSNETNGQDHASALLTVIDGVQVAITPPVQAALAGETAYYSVVITNPNTFTQTYTLALDGLNAETAAQLPPTIVVPGSRSQTLELAVTADYQAGSKPFTVTATSGSGRSSNDEALLEVIGNTGVALAIVPATQTGGAGAASVYTVTVANVGDVRDTFDLAVDLPLGWTYEWQANGMETTPLTLAADLFNEAYLYLLVTPPAGTDPNSYPFTITATSRINGLATAHDTAALVVEAQGVAIDILDLADVVTADSTVTWDVVVRNTGTVSDTFRLDNVAVAGEIGTFSQDSVALATGDSTTVQLSVDLPAFLLPSANYPVQVSAVSAALPSVSDSDRTDLFVDGFEDVRVSWLPDTHTVLPGESTVYMLAITNTGNVLADFDLVFDTIDGITLTPETDSVVIPPHLTAMIRVVVDTGGEVVNGRYDLVGAAGTDQVVDSDTALLIISGEPSAVALQAITVRTAQWVLWVLWAAVALGLFSVVLGGRGRRER